MSFFFPHILRSEVIYLKFCPGVFLWLVSHFQYHFSVSSSYYSNVQNLGLMKCTWNRKWVFGNEPCLTFACVIWRYFTLWDCEIWKTIWSKAVVLTNLGTWGKLLRLFTKSQKMSTDPSCYMWQASLFMKQSHKVSLYNPPAESLRACSQILLPQG